MATYWNRTELSNPPNHLENRRREAGYEWVPLPGSKRKLDICPEDRAYEEEIKPCPKLAAIDETIQDDILDKDGYIKGYEVETALSQNVLQSEPEAVSKVAEPEPMMMDEEGERNDTETGLPTCMVKDENKTNGGGNGYQHEFRYKFGNKMIQGMESLILSHEVQNSMAKKPVDISTVLAQKMFKQATMAVVLWKPQVAIPLGGIEMNSPELHSQSSKRFDANSTNSKTRSEEQEDKMET